jgi:hypothetical protein
VYVKEKGEYLLVETLFQLKNEKIWVSFLIYEDFKMKTN